MSTHMSKSFTEHALKLLDGRRIWEPSGRIVAGKRLWRSRAATPEDVKRLGHEASIYRNMR